MVQGTEIERGDGVHACDVEIRQVTLWGRLDLLREVELAWRALIDRMAGQMAQARRM